MNPKNSGKSAKPSFPSVGVRSGQVMTVLGPVPVEDMGITLTHEHILLDMSCFGVEPEEVSRKLIYHKPLDLSILAEVNMLPHCNRDNEILGDIDVASDEVAKFRHWGGRSIIEMTSRGLGRDPLGLRQISRRSGVQIVMGSGFYMTASWSDEMHAMSTDDIADDIVRDITEGVPGTGVHGGIIGELAPDLELTPDDEKSIRGGARASKKTQVPLAVHLPGGLPIDRPHRILDMIEEEGADLRHVLFCHVQLNSRGLEAQAALADRGVFLGYDGISQDYDWGIRGIGPCDEENASDIKQLIDAGYIHHILLSQDVAMKVQLTRYGGYGYAYILRRFVHRLRAHGVTDAQIETLLIENPRRLFSAKHRDAE